MSTLEIPLVRDKKETKKIENEAIDVYDSVTEVSSVAEIQFLICPSCLWCASYIDPSSGKNYETLSHCVICKIEKIESIPIGSNESYKVKSIISSCSS